MDAEPKPGKRAFPLYSRRDASVVAEVQVLGSPTQDEFPRLQQISIVQMDGVALRDLLHGSIVIKAIKSRINRQIHAFSRRPEFTEGLIKREINAR